MPPSPSAQSSISIVPKKNDKVTEKPWLGPLQNKISEVYKGLNLFN